LETTANQWERERERLSRKKKWRKRRMESEFTNKVKRRKKLALSPLSLENKKKTSSLFPSASLLSP
jgi:hypothetical protein